jgi:hypothetical protein
MVSDLGPFLIPIASELLVSLLVFVAGYFLGKYRERRLARGRNLDEYDFYPFRADATGVPQFSLPEFRRGVGHLLKNHDLTAARQLIFIGEQNGVRFALEGRDLRDYEHLYRTNGGESVQNDNAEYLENFRRIVRLLGQTWRQMGIEVLLHDLMNPARSIVEIENGEVTGRKAGMGTTMLVLDLKRRKALNEDKLNYELDIGGRRFKCTTIPIFRVDYGLIGAICLNIDLNYISERVLRRKRDLEDFFANYCRTDMVLDENILGPEEYRLALAGKTSWADEQHRVAAPPHRDAVEGAPPAIAGT